MDFCSHDRRSRPYTYKPAGGCQALPRYVRSTLDNNASMKQFRSTSKSAQSHGRYAPLSSMSYASGSDFDGERGDVGQQKTKSLRGNLLCSKTRCTKIFTSSLPADQQAFISYCHSSRRDGRLMKIRSTPFMEENLRHHPVIHDQYLSPSVFSSEVRFST